MHLLAPLLFLAAAVLALVGAVACLGPRLSLRPFGRGAVAAATALFVLGLATPALAQTTTAPSTTINLGPWYDLALPYLLALFSAVVTAAIGVLSAQVYRWFGYKMDETQRAAVHRAATTFIASQLAKLGKKADEVDVNLGSTLAVQGADYIRAVVPGAVKRLGATPEALENVAIAKLTELQAAVPSMASLPPAKA